MTKVVPKRMPTPDAGSLFRRVAWDRLASAEPLDELLTLPKADNRAGLLALALLLCFALIVIWMSA
ncbi:MAG: hypothetical protein GZ088_00765 [Acidipila sp.]|nr:hypothetical protein [Acidipila sp.]